MQVKHCSQNRTVGRDKRAPLVFFQKAETTVHEDSLHLNYKKLVEGRKSVAIKKKSFQKES